MTPYTSLLVLETDADRERFEVKRRFQMRDGEQFFAEGRDNANFELAQQQMKRAGDWRLGLRRNVLNQFARLGRDPAVYARGDSYGGVRLSAESAGGCGSAAARSTTSAAVLDPKRRSTSWAERGNSSEWTLGLTFGNTELADLMLDGAKAKDSRPCSASPASRRHAARGLPRAEAAVRRREPREGRPYLESLDADLDKLNKEVGRVVRQRGEARGSSCRSGSAGESARPDRGRASGATPARAGKPYGYHGRRPARPGYDATRWFDPLFPHLATPAVAAAPTKADWPKEARDLARSLLRQDALAKLAGGVAVERRTDSFDPRDGTLTGTERRVELVSPSAWATRTETDARQTLTEWCDVKERGVSAPPSGSAGCEQAPQPTSRSAVGLERLLAGAQFEESLRVA